MKEIYSRAMAVYLRKLGFKIEAVEINPYRPEFNMYLFRDCPELQMAMSRYTKEVSKFNKK
jgi:hypothetical protein